MIGGSIFNLEILERGLRVEVMIAFFPSICRICRNDRVSKKTNKK